MRNSATLRKNKDQAELPKLKPKSVIRLLRANTLSFCHLSRRFSITMEPHCALKAAGHLFNNKGYYHHNANDRFGLNKNYISLLY